MDGELTHKIATFTAQLDEARKEADLDTVTGLSSRRMLDRELARATYLQKLSGDPICLLLIDLHRFKNINDLHGHATGDELAVLLLYVTRGDGKRLAERFLDELRQRELGDEEATIRVAASAGVAEIGILDTAGTDVERAGRALYEAKAAGRDRVAVAPDLEHVP